MGSVIHSGDIIAVSSVEKVKVKTCEANIMAVKDKFVFEGLKYFIKSIKS